MDEALVSKIARAICKSMQPETCLWDGSRCKMAHFCHRGSWHDNTAKTLTTLIGEEMAKIAEGLSPAAYLKWDEMTDWGQARASIVPIIAAAIRQSTGATHG